MKTCFLILIICVVALPVFSQNDTTKMQAVDSVVYTCPMHPDVLSNKPGKCPKCGMDLVQQTSSPEAHKMNMMMCPMHGMVEMNHKHDEQKNNNMKMMKGVGIGMGIMMVVMMILLGTN
jgi:putative DNA topoisomerase